MSSESVSKRISKYIFHYLITLPVIILLIVYKVNPAFKWISVAFKDYNFSNGLHESPWVGLENFKKLFDSYYFGKVFTNTLIIKFEYILLCGALSLILALALSSINNKKIRSFFTKLFLVPYFIPTIVLCYIAILNLGSRLFVNKDYFRNIAAITEVIKTCGIPTIIAAGAIAARREGKSKIIVGIKAVVAFMLIQITTLLTTDFEILNTLLNPLVHEVGDTVDTFIFTNSFAKGQLGIGVAAGFIKFAVQLVLTIIVYLLLKHLFMEELFVVSDHKDRELEDKSSANVIGIIVSVLYSIFVALLLYQLIVRPFMGKSMIESKNLFTNMPIGSSFVIYIIATLVAVIINALITVILAYPLTVYDLPGRHIYKAFLLFVMCIGYGGAAEYLFFRSQGMVNTVFPYIITGMFNIVNIFVLKSIFNSKYHDAKQKASKEGKSEANLFFKMFLPKIFKPLVGLSVLQFVVMWNSYYTSLIYTMEVSKFSPVMIFKSIITGGGEHFADPTVMKYALLVSLPGLILFAVFGRLFNSSVFVSQTRRW